MKYFSTILLVLSIICRSAAQDCRDVNPFIGTGGHGHTFPGPVSPFGMVQLSPDTRTEGWDACSGYHYSDSTILGFSHTHLSGTGVGDYCDILISPFSYNKQSQSPPNPDRLPEPHHFNKADEKAHAGYYEVWLDRQNIKARLTATDRTGIHEYRFAKPAGNGIMLNLRHRDKVIAARAAKTAADEISGYRISSGWAKEQHVYFSMRFSQKISDITYSKDSQVMLILFERLNSNKIVIQCALSPVDMDGAKRNLEKEWSAFRFDQARKSCEKSWEHMLSRIKFDPEEDDEKNSKQIFYTSLYHTLIHPSLSQDADGRYRGLDQKIYQGEPDKRRYTVFSLWDTYRAAHPLYQLAYPEYNLQFARTFIQQFDEVGRLPVWELSSNETYCMIGNHAIPVLAMCCLDTLRTPGIDRNKACRAIEETFRAGYSDIGPFSEGYVPMNRASESVSKTIENSLDYYAYNLLCGKKGREPYYYRNLFNRETGFFQSKRNDQFISSFDPAEVNFNYTEANAWQYLFGAQHDIEGIKECLLSAEKIRLKPRSGMSADLLLEKKLDELFSATSKMTGRVQPDITGLIGQYAHGNEPSHHVSYLYNYCNRSDKTQNMVNRIMHEFYKADPDGLCGNEDCGQMSAWYVLSALGFYPVNPVNGKFTPGRPLGSKSRISVPGLDDIELKARKNDDDLFVKEIKINGKKVNSDFSLMPGDEVEFKFDKTQSIKLNNANGRAEKYAVLPTFRQGQEVFEDSTVMELYSQQGAEIQYCLDTTGPIYSYKSPVTFTENTTIFFRNSPKGAGQQENWRKAAFIKKSHKFSYKAGQVYDNQYHAGGNEALADGLEGSDDFRDGYWQGYWGTDIDIDLQRNAVLKEESLQVGMLLNEGSWILLPAKIEVMVSADGKDYRHFQTIGDEGKYKNAREGRNIYFCQPIGEKYVRLKIVNPGVLPSAHLSAGNPSWMFIDEITFR